jgi:hypothetical protein
MFDIIRENNQQRYDIISLSIEQDETNSKVKNFK